MLFLVGLCVPAEDGIELVRKIRKSGSNRITPIMLISGDQHPGALSRGSKPAPKLLLYKPIDKAHLMRLIRVTRGTHRTPESAFSASSGNR